MTTSDQVALLALVISLVSFWLSYRAHKDAQRVSAAEKRTEAHAVLMRVLLEAHDLRDCVQVAVDNDTVEPQFRERLAVVQNKLLQMVGSLEQRLEWLRSGKSSDPLQLESYKSHALEVEARVRQISPLIRELKVPTKSFWESGP